MISRQTINDVITASNIRTGSSSVITVADFLAVYPQFANDETVPEIVLQMMLDEANASIQEARWHSMWRRAVCLYVAHNATLWLKTKTDADAPASTIVHKGDSNGAMHSKSVGGVSVSYGSTSGDGDLVGFGSLRDTIYGQQLASLAKLVGKGMMYVR